MVRYVHQQRHHKSWITFGMPGGGLTPPHVVKRNSPQLSTENGSVATISWYANTHFGRLSVIEIVPYTHIIVLQEKFRHAYWYTSDAEILTYKKPPKPRVKKDQATAAIHSQNTTVENYLKYY
jgi:hypothetical protein